MTPDHCAGLLREADPDRFAIVIAAERQDRARLATLYAANLDIARAAIASKEPLISEMRLQWWTDQIAAIVAGHTIPCHEILSPLAEAWGAEIAPLAGVIEARRRDALRQPFATEEEVIAHIDGCTGKLMRLAVAGCGHEGHDTLIRNQARGAGLASWIGNYQQIRVLNLGLMPEAPERLAGLAQTGLDAFDSARSQAVGLPRRIRAPLYAGAAARRVLHAVSTGKNTKIPEFHLKLSRFMLAGFGRWQG